MLYVLFGPSGGGKSTLAREMEKLGVKKVVTYTTRKMRPGEMEGRDYHFVSRDDFSRLDLLEQTEYAGHLYGVGRDEVKKTLAAYPQSYIILDRPGLARVKKAFPGQVKSIYVVAREEILERRLLARGDTPAEVALRMEQIRQRGEMEAFDTADYVIKNEDGRLEQSIKILQAILGRGNKE